MKLCLCCISNKVAEQGFKFQTMTYKRFSSLDQKEALEILSKRIINNFSVTEKIIRFCASNNIKGYRFSSSLIPVINHPKVNKTLFDLPNQTEIFQSLNLIKKAIKETGIKCSAHPSEYISLTSKNPIVITNSINDLELHGFLFDLLEIPQNYDAPLNIHCRQDGDPKEISETFLSNFDKLSFSVKSRLVLENNDNKNGTWNINNLHKFYHQKIKIPITFDVLHHSLCNDGTKEQDAFLLAYETWNTIPLFHYSEGIDGKRKHADLPEYKPNSYFKDVFWDVELKGKDYAIEKIQKNVL